MEPRVTPPGRSAAPEASVGNRRATMRMIRDPELGMVVVYELDPSSVDSGPRTLIFESAASRLRVCDYPPDWRRVSESALLALRRAATSGGARD